MAAIDCGVGACGGRKFVLSSLLVDKVEESHHPPLVFSHKVQCVLSSSFPASNFIPGEKHQTCYKSQVMCSNLREKCLEIFTRSGQAMCKLFVFLRQGEWR